MIINAQYYNGQADRAAQRERQLATYSVANAKGRKFAITFNVADGNNLVADLVIN